MPEPLSIAHEGTNMQHVNDPRFYRSNNRILGGVSAGLAEGFHLDVLWVRVAFLFLLFVQGLGLFIYVVLWLVMPERLEGGGQRSGFDAMMTDVKRIWGDLQHQLGSTSRPLAPSTGAATASAPASTDPPPATSGPAAASAQPEGAWRNQTSLVGVIVLVIGLGLLGNNIGIFNWSVVWPAGLIVLGIVVLVRNLDTRP
jgi:phage shock protein PspC (stress-responsive transcriptional regulator)